MSSPPRRNNSSAAVLLFLFSCVVFFLPECYSLRVQAAQSVPDTPPPYDPPVFIPSSTTEIVPYDPPVVVFSSSRATRTTPGPRPLIGGTTIRRAPAGPPSSARSTYPGWYTPSQIWPIERRRIWSGGSSSGTSGEAAPVPVRGTAGAAPVPGTSSGTSSLPHFVQRTGIVTTPAPQQAAPDAGSSPGATPTTTRRGDHDEPVHSAQEHSVVSERDGAGGGAALEPTQVSARGDHSSARDASRRGRSSPSPPGQGWTSSGSPPGALVRTTQVRDPPADVGGQQSARTSPARRQLETTRSASPRLGRSSLDHIAADHIAAYRHRISSSSSLDRARQAQRRALAAARAGPSSLRVASAARGSLSRRPRTAGPALRAVPEHDAEQPLSPLSVASSTAEFVPPDFPADLMCPILQEPLTDAVVLTSGRSYDRKAVQIWDAGINMFMSNCGTDNS